MKAQFDVPDTLDELIKISAPQQGTATQDEKNFIVYVHVLKNDGRFYIGQTNGTMSNRAGSNGHRYNKCTKFFNAIQKYGWNNFDHIVLFEHCTLEEANFLEGLLITKYDALEKGFNIVYGGRNHTYTEEQRKQMSLRNLGEKNPNYGKPRSEECRRKISEANKISQKGKHHNEETKQKMSFAHRKDISIRCIETGVIYSCPVEAGLAITGKKSAGHITEACKGIRKTAYGYHWEYVNNNNQNQNKTEE